MEGLAKYCDTLRQDGSKTTLAGLYSFRAVLVTFIILASIIQPIYIYSVFPRSFSILQGIEATLPFTYWALIIATMIWTFGYSMFAIFRMGRLPLKLKSFTEDRELGSEPLWRRFAQADRHLLSIGGRDLRAPGCPWLLDPRCPGGGVRPRSPRHHAVLPSIAKIPRDPPPCKARENEMGDRSIHGSGEANRTEWDKGDRRLACERVNRHREAPRRHPSDSRLAFRRGSRCETRCNRALDLDGHPFELHPNSIASMNQWKSRTNPEAPRFSHPAGRQSRFSSPHRPPPVRSLRRTGL